MTSILCHIKTSQYVERKCLTLLFASLSNLWQTLPNFRQQFCLSNSWHGQTYSLTKIRYHSSKNHSIMRLVVSEIDHMTPPLSSAPLAPASPSFLVNEFPSKQVLRGCTILYLDDSYSLTVVSQQILLSEQMLFRCKNDS
jgi:hypothetical protein